MNFCSSCGHRLHLAVPPGDDRARFVCDACGTVHYQNPRVVVGCIPEHEGRVLLCRRAIEPRRGFWTIPAGYLELGETTEEGAAREAWEEAGVEGRSGARKIGVFDYDKRLSGGQLQPVRVEVYPLEVLEVHEIWPEAHERQRQWMTPSEAAALVDEFGLASLLGAFEGRLASS